MSKNLRKCMRDMHLFCEAKSSASKRKILEKMMSNSKYFDAFYEIVNNIHEKCLPITKSDRKKFKKCHIKTMEKIYNKPKSKVIRKKLVKQVGGFLPILIPILTAVVTEVISNAISKKGEVSST